MRIHFTSGYWASADFCFGGDPGGDPGYYRMPVTKLTKRVVDLREIRRSTNDLL